MKGFKTIAFGILIAVTALLADETTKQFILENFGLTGSFVGGAVVTLRAITTSPIFKKD
jgi:hypothetical protein